MGLDAALAEEATPANTVLESKSAPKSAIDGIARYPVELIDVVVLGGGQRVTIRPVLPQDDSVTKAFFRSLSAPSRYNRFMRAFHDLPEPLLTYFTQVDYRAHLALIAEIFVDGHEIAVGEARYVASADGMSAEFAVSIADDWQGQGLGTLLLSRLIKNARKAGIDRINGETLGSNSAMLHMARKAGFSFEIDREIAGLVHLSLNAAEVSCEVRCGRMPA